MFEEVQETLPFLPSNDFEQDEKISKISNISNAIILKVIEHMMQSFCQIKPSSFDG